MPAARPRMRTVRHLLSHQRRYTDTRIPAVWSGDGRRPGARSGRIESLEPGIDIIGVFRRHGRRRRVQQRAGRMAERLFFFFRAGAFDDSAALAVVVIVAVVTVAV